MILSVCFPLYYYFPSLPQDEIDCIFLKFLWKLFTIATVFYLSKYLSIFILLLFANIVTLYMTVSFIGREYMGILAQTFYFAQYIINKFLYKS